MKKINYIIVTIVVGIIIFPLIWMFVSSFKEQSDFITNAFRILPTKWSLTGYVSVVKGVPVARWFANSIIIAVVETILRVVIAIFSGFAFVRYEFRGKKAIFAFILISIVVPHQIIVVPMFISIAKMGLLNTYMGVILPIVVNGYAIFYMKQSFSEVPIEMVDASKIDGANELQLLGNVFIALSRPAIAAIVIVMFVSTWNDYQWPMLVMQQEKMFPLTVAINYFMNETSTNWSAALSVAVLTAIPVVGLYVVFQKQFVEALVSSGIKG